MYVTIYRIECYSQPGPTVKSPAELHTKHDQPRDELTVLIADDDEAMRLLLKEALIQWGFNVIEAKDGEEAWEVMQQANAPRLLILDWRMPKLDGVQLCERIRKQLDFYPYIIFLSQVSGAENILTGFDAGANEFLIKPVNFKELRSRLIAGEKILEFIQVIDDQNKQLKSYVARIEQLEQLVDQLRKTK